MKLASARPKASMDQVREQWRRSRAAAQTLVAAFPQVESIRLELKFAQQTARGPAPQAYVLHPAANAFFEYCCPHSDCDGRFDLTTAVRSLVQDNGQQFEGSADCRGERLKNSTGKQSCQLHLKYTVNVAYCKS